MRASRYQFVCLMVLLLVCLAGHACFAMDKPLGDFSYTLSLGGHPIHAAAWKSGKLSLVVDGKERPRRGSEWPHAYIGKTMVSLMDNGALDICLSADSDDDISLEVSSAAAFHPDTKKATELKVGKRTVFREKSTYGGEAESPKPCYDFYYLVNSGGLVFMVSQSTPLKNKNMTKEFREVAETFEIGRTKK